MANLSYIKNFRFSSSAKDELGYCLTSVEAAIEYIRRGSLSAKPPVSRTPALPPGEGSGLRGSRVVSPERGPPSAAWGL